MFSLLKYGLSLFEKGLKNVSELLKCHQKKNPFQDSFRLKHIKMSGVA